MSKKWLVADVANLKGELIFSADFCLMEQIARAKPDMSVVKEYKQ